jgi:hypothetical protein
MTSDQPNPASVHRFRRRPRSRLLAAFLGALGLLATVLISPAQGHPSDAADGHVPANTNYGFEVIGQDTLAGVADGLYTDVWSHDGYAYVGTFQEPVCSTAGVYIVDMAAAIANYPDTSGTTVAEIKSPPDTRINDVKVHTVGNTDVLITTEEPCGAGIAGGAVSDFNINKACPISSDRDDDGFGDCNRANDNGRKNEPGRSSPGAASQKGRGGISLWDVSDPTQPKPLAKSFLDYRGVHNTYAWTDENGSYLIGVADTFDFLDTFIVDITNPKKPELIVQTGVLDWLDDGFSFAQLETGTFGAILLHDVWVEEIDGEPVAVLSYWDAGFITLDLSDPANPQFIGDSDYPNPDPITGLPYEGNAHAAVFGGTNGEYIFGGDEDFDALETALEYLGELYAVGLAGFGPDSSTISGEIVWTGGEGCTPADVPAATADGQIALMQRGTCFFQDKADSAEAQGYAGYIVANDAARGDDVLTMGARDDAPVGIPGIFVGYSVGELMKANGGSIDGLSQKFNGWGYLHILNNTGGTVTVPDQVPGPIPTVDIPQLGEIGFYAPAETVEAEFTPGNGDLTMHNIEADPLTQGLEPTFNQGPRMFVSWYSLGMRAVEYRPGHWHDNSNGEGSYSWNVHEVGRWIEPDGGSNFWGVHVDEIDGDQVIVASDRNNGLYIFEFSCETKVDIGGEEVSVFYCDPDAGGSDG